MTRLTGTNILNGLGMLSVICQIQLRYRKTETEIWSNLEFRRFAVAVSPRSSSCSFQSMHRLIFGILLAEFSITQSTPEYKDDSHIYLNHESNKMMVPSDARDGFFHTPGCVPHAGVSPTRLFSGPSQSRTGVHEDNAFTNRPYHRVS